MMKRNLFMVLFGALALTAAPMIGCGGTDDPSDNNQENNTEPNNQENNTEPNNGTPGTECEINESFYGQIGTGEDQDGGVPTSEPLTESAGLQEVWDAVEAEIDGDIGGAEDEISLDLSSDPIEVDGAVVTAKIFRGFYVSDGDAAFYVDNRNTNDDLEVDNDDVRVGQKVSFDVTGAGTFFADPQISGLTNWEVLEEDVEVPVEDITDEPIEVEHMYHNVRAAVLLPPTDEDSWDCAGDICYPATYGEDQQFEITMKIGEDSFWEPGECRTFVGPVSTFPGYFSGDPSPQLDELNWDWTGFPSF